MVEYFQIQLDFQLYNSMSTLANPKWWPAINHFKGKKIILLPQKRWPERFLHVHTQQLAPQKTVAQTERSSILVSSLVKQRQLHIQGVSIGIIKILLVLKTYFVHQKVDRNSLMLNCVNLMKLILCPLRLIHPPRTIFSSLILKNDQLKAICIE